MLNYISLVAAATRAVTRPWTRTRSSDPDLLRRGRVPRSSSTGRRRPTATVAAEIRSVVPRRSPSRRGRIRIVSARGPPAVAAARHRPLVRRRRRRRVEAEAAGARLANAAVGPVLSRLPPVSRRHFQLTASSVVGAQMVQGYADGACEHATARARALLLRIFAFARCRARCRCCCERTVPSAASRDNSRRVRHIRNFKKRTGNKWLKKINNSTFT